MMIENLNASLKPPVSCHADAEVYHFIMQSVDFFR